MVDSFNEIGSFELSGAKLDDVFMLDANLQLCVRRRHYVSRLADSINTIFPGRYLSNGVNANTNGRQWVRLPFLQKLPSKWMQKGMENYLQQS